MPINLSILKNKVCKTCNIQYECSRYNLYRKYNCKRYNSIYQLRLFVPNC